MAGFPSIRDLEFWRNTTVHLVLAGLWIGLTLILGLGGLTDAGGTSAVNNSFSLKQYTSNTLAASDWFHRVADAYSLAWYAIPAVLVFGRGIGPFLWTVLLYLSLQTCLIFNLGSDFTSPFAGLLPGGITGPLTRLFGDRVEYGLVIADYLLLEDIYFGVVIAWFVLIEGRKRAAPSEAQTVISDAEPSSRSPALWSAILLNLVTLSVIWLLMQAYSRLVPLETVHALWLLVAGLGAVLVIFLAYALLRQLLPVRLSGRMVRSVQDAQTGPSREGRNKVRLVLVADACFLALFVLLGLQAAADLPPLLLFCTLWLPFRLFLLLSALYASPLAAKGTRKAGWASLIPLLLVCWVVFPTGVISLFHSVLFIFPGAFYYWMSLVLACLVLISSMFRIWRLWRG